ncbi:integrase [Gossypium australe]|uniref:Integrase n=1 Tax=Gossypium australe TaxID=47621 RepID=A0A5B6UWS9_9ROSI|nr:integrase [Gossypium australe]
MSSIIQHITPPKYKDPGCTTISCIIGNTIIERALLDLGASLGLGELKPTSFTIQLADRSVKILRGIVEDMSVQIDKFYFLYDFITLDTHPVSDSTVQIPIILGLPFLVTSNALINYKNGVLNLSFGNMTLEFNVLSINIDQPPKLDLKQLPCDLKYSFLGENGTFPVIISTKLDAHQEGKLLKILKMHKNALR